MTDLGSSWVPDPAELEAIRLGSAALVKRTPVFGLGAISQRVGGRVMVKAENLQRTGSFKLRGALSKLRQGVGSHRGVIAASAGNHAQALAFAARAHGVECTVVMPLGAAVSKIEAVAAFGAEIRQVAGSVDDCIDEARKLAAANGLLFVHPFDDIEIVKGQAGVGLELLEQVEDLAQVIVPVGGGGLICGIAAALQATRPDVRVIGVQADGCAPFASALHGDRPITSHGAATIADGIAIKRPGELNTALAARWVEDVVVVDDDAIAEGMVLLAERGKLVVEGAGAAGVAALLAGVVKPDRSGTTAVVLSGGNVDAHLLASIINRQQTRIGRRARVYTRVSDRPGGLADLLQVIARGGGNVIDVAHVRDGVSLGLGETGVELAIEMRNSRQRSDLISSLDQAGYPVLELG